MKILAMDDNGPALKMLSGAIAEALPESEIYPFAKPSELLAFAETNPCDIAFLDIKMSGMNGITVAKELKDLNPKINIIFVTAHSQYASEAFTIYPSGYILKPVTEEAVLLEIANLRYPFNPKTNARIYIQTFGNFEAFSYGAPLKFRYSKSKELLAYLIDRNGASVNSNELYAILWEDRPDSRNTKSYLRKLIADLMKTLKEAGADDIIQKHYNNIAVIPDKIVCDSYGFMKGDPVCVNAYYGEYMAQYSWSETTMWQFRKTIMHENQKGDA